MALTLGLDTALSGLLTAQRGLDVISQNITNVNTAGYTRKVLNQQTVVLAGQGAGVQSASIGRTVDQGLLKNIRTQLSVLGGLDAQQQFFPQIEDLFGQVGDSTSIASTLTNMGTDLQSLSTSVSDPSAQYAAVQSAVSVTDQLNSMTQSLQNMRVSADNQISTAVTQVNQDLNTIYDLNQKIVRNGAINADTSDLMDQRDNAVNDLAKYMNITYFTRDDGSLIVYTGGGQTLLDNQPAQLVHSAASTTDTWMTEAGGQFTKLTLSTDPSADISGSISSGQIRALLDMRDQTIPNLQSQLDELATQLKNTINQISNRGTTQPTISNSYTGTRTFATQGTITPSAGDVASTITFAQGNQSVTAAAGAGGAGYGSLSFSYSTSDGQPTITAANAIFNVPPANNSNLISVGQTITISNSPTGPNDGTYTVTSVDPTGKIAEVKKVNPVQTFSLANGADTMITLFDTNGNQIASTSLNSVMATDYQGQFGLGASDPQAAAQATGGPWSIDSFSKHMQSWLQAQGYSNASVGLDANGHMAITLGSTAQASLAFRDQTSSTPGATAQDATVKFDADGDGTPDETVQGFSNFFGLNDIFVNTQPNSIMDSAVQPADFKVPISNPPRTLTLSDPSGQLGPTMTIAAGASLQDIATEINNDTQTNESGLQASTSLNLSSAATFTIQDANGTVESQTFGPGTVTLQQIATQLTSGTVTAQVVQDGNQYRLRMFDNRGVPLTVSVSGGAMPGSTVNLGSQLNIVQTHHILASVVPDGAGYRLRIVQADNRQLFASGNQDAAGGSVLSDLGLRTASTRESGVITVRSDMQGNPANIPRGAVQWNSTTGQYYLSEGDNTTALQLANAMSTKVAISTAGDIASGLYTFSEHAASSISLLANASANSQSQQSQQSTLQNSLNYQFTSISGVNLDEEVANLITFQRAYSASAKVVSTLDAMLQTLTDMIR